MSQVDGSRLEILEDRFRRKFLCTDEMRVTVNGADGWACGWITNGHRAPLLVWRQQGGGGGDGNGLLALRMSLLDIFGLKMTE